MNQRIKGTSTKKKFANIIDNDGKKQSLQQKIVAAGVQTGKEGPYPPVSKLPTELVSKYVFNLKRHNKAKFSPAQYCHPAERGACNRMYFFVSK